MTTTAIAIASHTVGIEPVTRETAPYCPPAAHRAVVERYDGRLVKVVVTDADQLHSTLDDYAKGAAHAYGANVIDTAQDQRDTIALNTTASDVLIKMARFVNGPYNASLPEALHLATRNPDSARKAVQRLADTLKLHPRSLAFWDVTRTRNQVADMLRLAAGIIAPRPAVTR